MGRYPGYLVILREFRRLERPWGGSWAQKYVKMEAQTWIFYDFRKLFPRDFGDTLEIFPVFHDLQIDNTRCSVYGCLCLGLGGKPTVDASQMLPRCLPDAVCLLPSSPLLPVGSKMASPQERSVKKTFEFFET